MDIDVAALLAATPVSSLGPLGQTLSPIAWSTSFRTLSDAERAVARCLHLWRPEVAELAAGPDGARRLFVVPVESGLRLTGVGRLPGATRQQKFAPDTVLVLLEAKDERVQVVSASGGRSHGLAPWAVTGDDAVLQQLFGIAFHEDSRDEADTDAQVVQEWVERTPLARREATAAALRRVDLRDPARVGQAVQGAWCGSWLTPVTDRLLPTWWEALAAAVEAPAGS